MTTSRDSILEALRARSLPEASECNFVNWMSGGGFHCFWPAEDEEACEFPLTPFWGYGATTAEAYSAMCDKIEKALKEQK